MGAIYKNGIKYGGGSVDVDDVLSSTSENPVQNKVINTALNDKVASSGGSIADTVLGSITTSTASYPEISSSDTAKGAFGKIKKFLADLKSNTSAKRYQILYNSGWSQVSVSGTTYYRYTLTLTYATGGVPKIDIAEGSAAIPTANEKAAWDLIEYCTVDDSTYKTVYLYAKTQPTSNFYVRVWGCGGEM